MQAKLGRDYIRYGLLISGFRLTTGLALYTAQASAHQWCRTRKLATNVNGCIGVIFASMMHG